MLTRILVADALDPQAFEELREVGAEVEFRPELTAETLATAISGYKILIVRRTPVTAATIQAAQSLALIVRAGSGTSTIDVDAASAYGIYVSSCPGKNSAAVAELVFGLLLAIDRRIPDNVQDIRSARWNQKGYLRAPGLKGRRLGVVGFGFVGREVAARALGFDMRVLVYSRSLTESAAADAHVQRATSLEQLFRDSEVVSLHLPLTPETQALISRRLLGLMPLHAVFLNTARAEIVDEAALFEVAQLGKIWVGTDVFHQQPTGDQGVFQDRLGALPNVYGTQHIGAATLQAQTAIACETVRIVRHFVTNAEVIAPVNLLLTPVTVGTLILRHFNRVGVLAAVLSRLRDAHINVETMENVVFSGGKAACARIRVAEWPNDSLLGELQQLEHMIHVELV